MGSSLLTDLSYWEKKRLLEGGDIAIIGGGLTGMFAALFLSNRFPEWQITIYEKRPMGALASTRNAGFACFGSPSELLSDIEYMGFDAAVSLAVRRWDGLNRLLELVPSKEMHFIRDGGTEIFLPGSEYFEKSLEFLPELNSAFRPTIGPEVFRKLDEYAAGWAGAIEIRHEGQLDPVRLFSYLRKKLIASDVRIINGVALDDYQETNEGVRLELLNIGEVCFDRLLLATNALTGQFDRTVIPARNIVLMSKPLPKLELKGSYHEDRGYVYFRPVDGRLLIGGGRNWEPVNTNDGELGGEQEQISRLEDYARSHIPGAEDFHTEQSWSGLIAVSGNGDKAPLIEKIGDQTFVAGRLNGMGVALSNVVAEDVVRMISDHEGEM